MAQLIGKAPSLSGGVRTMETVEPPLQERQRPGGRGWGGGFCGHGAALRASVLATLCSHFSLIPLYVE